MNLISLMKAVEAGFKAWKDKPHNAKWARHIDGTPIENDLTVCIAEAVMADLEESCQHPSPASGTVSATAAKS